MCRNTGLDTIKRLRFRIPAFGTGAGLADTAAAPQVIGCRRGAADCFGIDGAVAYTVIAEERFIAGAHIVDVSSLESDTVI